MKRIAAIALGLGSSTALADVSLQLTGLKVNVVGSAEYGGGGFNFQCTGTDTSLNDLATNDGYFNIDIKMTFPSCQTNYGYKDIYLHVVGQGSGQLSQNGEDGSVSSSGILGFGHFKWGSNGPFDIYNSEGSYSVRQDSFGTVAATGNLQVQISGQTTDGKNARVSAQISYITE